MHVFGVKDAGEADKARGTEADIIIADEYGFWRYKPEYILKSVLSPQLDDTDGQLIITSTPPEDLTHPYIEELAVSEAEETLFHWPIEKSLELGEISERRHARIIERCGGIDTDAYKREYKLDLVANKSRLVIPEAQFEESYVGKKEKRPEYYYPYFCCDLGLSDFFHGLFGYVDFKQARLIVEKEYCANYQSTGEISSALKTLEAELCFMNMHKIRRLGDSSDPQQLFDMSKDHDYPISPITKRSKMNNTGFKESVLNGLRVAIKQQRILVDKKGCPILVAQLKYGIWNERRTDFERSEKLGHLDGLMALAYMWDNTDFEANPYPALSHNAKDSTHFINHDLYNKTDSNELKKLTF